MKCQCSCMLVMYVFYNIGVIRKPQNPCSYYFFEYLSDIHGLMGITELQTAWHLGLSLIS